MDVGKFKASQKRLMMWITVPPLLISSVGLSAYAWKQQAEWKLKQTESLSEALPVVIQARTDAGRLISDLGLNKESAIGSEDQLISFLQEAAMRRGFTIDSVQVVRREAKDSQGIPVLMANIEGTGEFTAIQLYINEVQSAQHMLSVNTLELTQPRQQIIAGNGFKANISFNLLLIDEILQTTGDVQ